MSLKKVEKCLLAGHPSTIQILFFGVEKISILLLAEIWSIENGTRERKTVTVTFSKGH